MHNSAVVESCIAVRLSPLAGSELGLDKSASIKVTEKQRGKDCTISRDKAPLRWLLLTQARDCVTPSAKIPRDLAARQGPQKVQSQLGEAEQRGKRQQHAQTCLTQSLLQLTYKAGPAAAALCLAWLSTLGLYDTGVDIAGPNHVPPLEISKPPSPCTCLCAFLFHKTTE